jgi:menaquinone-dependent protoporphyrinogen oxidase
MERCVVNAARQAAIERERHVPLGGEQANLEQLLASFVACMTMAEPTEEKRAEVQAYLDPLRQAAPEVQPVGVGLFAGAVTYSKLPLPLRLLLKAMKVPEGDYRDWQAIRSWAESVRPGLLGE